MPLPLLSISIPPPQFHTSTFAASSLIIFWGKKMEVDAPQQKQPNAAEFQAEFTSSVHRCGHAAWNSTTAEQQQMRDHQKA